jgi:hypothetical protein
MSDEHCEWFAPPQTAACMMCEVHCLSLSAAVTWLGSAQFEVTGRQSVLAMHQSPKGATMYMPHWQLARGPVELF